MQARNVEASKKTKRVAARRPVSREGPGRLLLRLTGVVQPRAFFAR